MGEALRTIAAEMWAEAESIGRSSRTLPGGLFIVCKEHDGERRLGLHRPGAAVPFDEAAIARRYFKVPALHQYEQPTTASGSWRVYIWCQPTTDQLAMPLEAAWQADEPYDYVPTDFTDG